MDLAQLRRVADTVTPRRNQRDSLLPVGAVQGVVVSVQTPTVTLTLGGSSTPVAGVHYLGSAPAAGATVWVLTVGQTLLVLGTQS